MNIKRYTYTKREDTLLAPEIGRYGKCGGDLS